MREGGFWLIRINYSGVACAKRGRTIVSNNAIAKREKYFFIQKKITQKFEVSRKGNST